MERSYEFQVVERSTKSQRGPPQRGLSMRARVLLTSAILFVVGIVILVHNDFIRLYPKNIDAELLEGTASRIEYAIRYQVLLAAWLFFMVVYTIYIRLSSGALNPLDSHTEVVAHAAKNILTNSVEQIILACMNQFAFVSFAEPTMILKFIPAINITLLIGRIAFFAGYPLYRSFGFGTTLSVQILLMGYNLYKFGSFINLY